MAYVALVSASTAGQGFHGVVRNVGGTFSSPLNPQQNAILRVSGDVVVPVELLEFDLD